MPFSPQTLEEKPYNICITCSRIGKTCDGPNFLAMSLERWCEWCRIRKDYLGWRNAMIAEKAGVSKVSIDRIMAGDVKDLRISTMQAVTRAMINGSWGQYPCALVNETEVYVDNPVLVAHCQHLQDALDRAAVDHKADVEATRAEAQRKIDFLRDQIAVKDKQIESLHGMLNARADRER